MLKWQHLKTRKDFLEVSEQGQVFKTPAFVLLYTDSDSCRIGYTASRRSVGGAVQRNRAKRRLRALTDSIIRLNPQFTLPDGSIGVDMVLIARHSILQRSFESMQDELAKSLKARGCKI